MKKTLYILAALFLSNIALCQTVTENYVHSTSYQVATQTGNVSLNDKHETITYYDGLGRPKQNIVLRSGGQPTNELINDWSVGPISSSFYIQNGQASENSIVNGLSPFGETDLLWRCDNDPESNADGGWNTAWQSVDNSKAYRYSVWVKRTGDNNNGWTYHGTNNVSNLSGTSLSNPYFFAGNLPQANTWYLLVGVIHPHDYSGTSTGESGVYDFNGNKVMNANEFKWDPGTTTSRVRSYLYYCTDASADQYFWNPIFQKYDGNELPLSDLQVADTEMINTSKDIVKVIKYDDYGRKTKDYLPVPVANTQGLFNANDAVIQTSENYYSNQYPEDISNSLNVFSETRFEASPLNRVLEQGAPGQDWAVNATSDFDHTIKFDYQTNATSSVKLFKVSHPNNDTEQTALVYDGFYQANELYKTITKDENWQPNQQYDKDHTTEEFKNKQGQVVLKRTYNLNKAHDTYYVYDDYGNLTYVISPEGSFAISEANNGISPTVLEELCYIYHYDYRNRLVEKKIPGKDWEYIIYDTLDRPILTQDGIQRNKSVKEWLFTKYDVFGRVAYTGLYKNNGARVALQNVITNKINSDEYKVYESKSELNTISSDPTTQLFYTNNAFPITGNITVYTINYYDDYNFNLSSDLAFSNSYNQVQSINNKTLSTGSKVRVLDTNFWITTVTYYDTKARPIQTASQNEFLKTTDIYKSKLDFVGKVLETSHKHSNAYAAEEAIVVTDYFSYDHAGRLLTQYQTIDNEDRELIVNNHYDALGQLKSKNVGGAVAVNAEESVGLQQVDYNYNIRGWLTQINNVETLNNDLFGFNLNYNQTGQGVTPLYNGNISQSQWQTAKDNKQRGYNYTYDALNRISEAIYSGHQLLDFPSQLEDYSIKVGSYDKNGNINDLSRYGFIEDANQIGQIDRLEYKYTPNTNQLIHVIDHATKDGFKDVENEGEEYQYDINGNMVVDKNKGIERIEYNHLNLPTRVTINSGNENYGTISYIYDATGVKLKKEVSNEGNGNYEATIYAGNYIYKANEEKNILQFLNQPEGYIQPKEDGNGTYDYVYQYKDHLGNIRLAYSDSDSDGVISDVFFTDNLESANGWNSNGALYGASAEYDTSMHHSGNYSGKIVKTTSGEKFVHSDVWLPINNTGSNTYTFSGWVYSNGPSVDILLFMNTEGESGYYTNVESIRTYTTGDWVYLEKTVAVPSNIAYINVRVDNNGGGTIWFDDIKITKGDSEIIEENNYYPFGLEHKGYNNVVSSNGNSVAQKFKYNGVEYEESLGLDLYEMDVRSYDPAIGRFTSIDPIIHFDYSTYQAFDNNPIFWADPSGADAESKSTEDLINDAWNATPENGSATFDNQGNCNCGCPGKPACEPNTSPPDFKSAKNAGEFQAMAYSMNGYQAFASRNGLNGLTAFQVMEYDDAMDQFGAEVITWVAGGIVFKLIVKGGKVLYGAYRANKALKGAKFLVDPNKFNYFFGRVVSGNAHNITRSAQNLKDLTTLGIQSEGQLMRVFAKAFANGSKVGTRTTDFGTIVTKSINIAKKGKVEVSFFYKGGNMSSTPSVTTIIPKIFK